MLKISILGEFNIVRLRYEWFFLKNRGKSITLKVENWWWLYVLKRERQCAWIIASQLLQTDSWNKHTPRGTGGRQWCPPQSSCLENPMEGGAWWAAARGVTQSWTRLSDFIFTFHFLAVEKEMATTPVFLPGESRGRGSLVGCRLWGRTESDTTEAT